MFAAPGRPAAAGRSRPPERRGGQILAGIMGALRIISPSLAASFAIANGLVIMSMPGSRKAVRNNDPQSPFRRGLVPPAGGAVPTRLCGEKSGPEFSRRQNPIAALELAMAFGARPFP